MRAVKEMGVRAAVSLVEMDLFDPKATAAKKRQPNSFWRRPTPVRNGLSKDFPVTRFTRFLPNC